MLIIIGNGFDLSLGLETSWSHFLKSKEFNEAQSDSYELFSHLKDKHEIQNWIDVENELGEYAKVISGYSGKDSHIKRFKKEFDILSQSLLFYFSKNNIGEKLVSWQNTKAGELVEKTRKIITKEVKSVNIVNFNYTNTFKHLLGMKEDEESAFHITNIHGSYNSKKIIFGYESSNNKLPPRDFGFIKKSYYTSNDKVKILKKQLKEESEIVIFGHSLRETDHIYFKDFFLELKNEQTEKDVKIFYHKDSNPIHAEIDTMIDNTMHELKNSPNISLKFIDTDNSEHRYSLMTEFERDQFA